MSEGLALASAVFAAIAAAGSAGAAWVMYRSWAAGVVPAVSLDLAESPEGVLVLTIHNFGAPAKKLTYAVIEGTNICAESIPHGFLETGGRVRIKVDMPSAGRTVIAVAYAFDLSARHFYAWAANGQSGRWRARHGRLWRKPTDATQQDILKRFYPQAPDHAELTPCESEAFAD